MKGGIVGPITFGEIAYQLLNPTMVYPTVSDVSGATRVPQNGADGTAGHAETSPSEQGKAPPQLNAAGSST